MRKLNQRGSFLVFLTLGFALVGTFIGFAVDFGRAYLEKAQSLPSDRRRGVGRGKSPERTSRIPERRYPSGVRLHADEWRASHDEQRNDLLDNQWRTDHCHDIIFRRGRGWWPGFASCSRRWQRTGTDDIS